MKRRLHLFDKNIVLSANLYFKAFQTGNMVVVYSTRLTTRIFYFTNMKDFLCWREDVNFENYESAFDDMIAFLVLNRDIHKLQSFDLWYGAFIKYYCNYSCDKAYKDYWHKVFKKR